MSGVLRNALRLAGTAKYVTNNYQTQYLRRSMSHVANCSNDITKNSATEDKSNDLSNCKYAEKPQDTQAKKESAVACEKDWNIISAAANKISSIAENFKNKITAEEEEEEEIPLKSNVGKFNLSLYGGTVTLKARGINKTYYWDAPLNIEGDKELMEKLQNTIAVKEEIKLGKFNLLFDDDKLILKIRGRDKSFTFNHKLDITEKSAKSLQDKILADYGTPSDMSKTFSQGNHFIVSACDTKITLKTKEGEKTFFPKLSNENEKLCEELSSNGLNIKEFTDENQVGIKTKENDKTFVSKYTINFQVNDEKPAENSNIENFLEIFRGNDKFEIIINSGEGTLRTQENDESYSFQESLHFVVDMHSRGFSVDIQSRLSNIYFV
ncbi:hypothetical protein HCN44_006305 [Aphidius gifuensis]|uniref:Uncharacterized protein n=1 Tax=Aphidius gifuensis TaxID=684658 RepID=A0A835CUD8_APHGI|nr:uncharacterized protein LOC122850958 [Aphidius gifuensis]KAF7993245.1 hypothetical protein HCN44_006305 [Aphidius gifuensis]